MSKDDDDLFLDYCIAENEKLINEQQKQDSSNQEVSKHVKIAEDVIVEYRERFLEIKKYVNDVDNDGSEIDEHIFYYSAYIDSEK